MKIINVDNETKKSKLKYILPIVKTGLGLGLTYYFMKTGVLNYDKLVNMDRVRDIFPNNIPMLSQEFDSSFKLVENVVNTVGFNKLILASKTFPFLGNITKPILESDKIQKSPVIHKIKEIFKGKKNVNQLDNNQENEQNPIAAVVEYQSNRNPEKKKMSRKVIELIAGAASLGLSAYLIATNQINFNNSYNFENLPHKFAKIKDIAKNLNINNVYLGIGALKLAHTALKRDTKTIETPPMMAAPINFEKIVRTVADFEMNMNPVLLQMERNNQIITVKQLKVAENEIQSPKKTLQQAKDYTIRVKDDGPVLE